MRVSSTQFGNHFGKFISTVNNHKKKFIGVASVIYMSYKVYPYYQYFQTLYNELNKSYGDFMLSDRNTNTIILDIGGAKMVVSMNKG